MMAYRVTYARTQDQIFSDDKKFGTFESALRSACKELLDIDKGWMEISDEGIFSPIATIHKTSAKNVPIGAKFILRTYTYIVINGGIGAKTEKTYLDKTGKVIPKKKR